MNDMQQILDRLESFERDQLPGFQAQKQMMPKFRRMPENTADLSDAAVMICLFHNDDGELSFPLIKRVHHELDRHSGQISLPGGRRDDGEVLSRTALREVHEEIGIEPAELRILCSLSPLPIPVSSFLVHPFVAYAENRPVMTVNPAEVQKIFSVRISELCDPENRKCKKQANHRIPHFSFNDHFVWGATAMILSEFAEIIRNRELIS